MICEFTTGFLIDSVVGSQLWSWQMMAKRLVDVAVVINAAGCDVPKSWLHECRETATVVNVRSGHKVTFQSYPNFKK